MVIKVFSIVMLFLYERDVGEIVEIKREVNWEFVLADVFRNIMEIYLCLCLLGIERRCKMQSEIKCLSLCNVINEVLSR